jgi:hypothetical protein
MQACDVTALCSDSSDGVACCHVHDKLVHVHMHLLVAGSIGKQPPQQHMPHVKDSDVLFKLHN